MRQYCLKPSKSRFLENHSHDKIVKHVFISASRFRELHDNMLYNPSLFFELLCSIAVTNYLDYVVQSSTRISSICVASVLLVYVNSEKRLF